MNCWEHSGFASAPVSGRSNVVAKPCRRSGTIRKWLLPGHLSGIYSENSIAKTMRHGREKCNSFVIAATPMCAKKESATANSFTNSLQSEDKPQGERHYICCLLWRKA
jgi:hypothetical protein